MRKTVQINVLGVVRAPYIPQIKRQLRKVLHRKFADARSVAIALDIAEDEKILLAGAIFRAGDQVTRFNAYYFPEWDKLELYILIEI